MAFEQYKFTQTRQVQPADMSEARVWESLANTMDRFSAQMGSINNANAARAKGVRNAQDSLDGMQAGTIAGGEGVLEFMDAGNAYNDAYNRGISASYEAGITNQINETLSTALQNNLLDPDGFATEALALDKVLTKGKSDYEVAVIRSTLERLSIQAQTTINGNVQTKVKEGQVAEILTANNHNITEMENMAYLGEATDEVMAIYNIRNDNAVGANLISASSVVKQQVLLKEALALRSTEGAFDRLLAEDGIAAATAALQEYKDDPTIIDAPLAKNQKLINELDRKVVNSQAIAKIGVEAAIKELEAGNSNLDITALAATVKGTSLEAPLINAQAISVDSAAFKGYNFVQMDIAEQSALKNIPEGTVKEALLKNYAEIRKHTTEMLEKDPYALALETGVVTGTSFDLSDPKTLQARVAEAEAASDFYGVKVPPMSQAEADGLRYIINEGNVEDNMAVFQQLATGFGSETDEVYKLMFTEGGGAFAAASGMMLQGDADTTKLILKGQDLIKNDTYPNILKTANTESSVNTLIDAAFGGAYVETPNHIEILRSGIRAAYAQLAAENGNYDATGGIDEPTLEKAIDKVTGGIVELEWQDSSGLIGGFTDANYSIEVPKVGMDAGDVEDWMESITEADIDSMGGVANMKSAEVAKIINSGRAKLHSVGHGQYTLRNMTGNWFTTAGEDGEFKPFVLTYIPPPPVSAKVAVRIDKDKDIAPAKLIWEQVLDNTEVNEDDPIDEMEASILGDSDFLNLRDLAGELEDQ